MPSKPFISKDHLNQDDRNKRVQESIFASKPFISKAHLNQAPKIEKISENTSGCPRQEDLTSQVEVLLVTVASVPEEIQAVRHWMAPWPNTPAIWQTSCETFVAEFGQFGCYRAAHICCTPGTIKMGNVRDMVQEAIQKLSPKAILMLGIAYGLKLGDRPEDQALGDVLVATSIFPLEEAPRRKYT